MRERLKAKGFKEDKLIEKIPRICKEGTTLIPIACNEWILIPRACNEGYIDSISILQLFISIMFQYLYK